MSDTLVDALRVLADGLPSKVCADAAGEITRLKAENARLREALEIYGQHDKDCQRFRGYAGPESDACVCGFRAALKGKP